MRRLILLPCAIVGLLLLTPITRSSPFLKRPLNAWRDDLKKADRPDLRRSAAFALGQIGPPAVVAMDDLIDRLKKDTSAGVREMAARAIGDIVLGIRPLRKPDKPESEWESAGKSLETALKDSDPRVRRSAAYALGAFGDLAIKCTPALRLALRDKSATVRQNAAWAIGKVGDSSDLTVRELCAVLSDESPIVRRLTASSLAEVTARQSKKSIDPALALLKMLKNEGDDVVCRTALGALATMADEGLQKHASDIYPLLESKDLTIARATAFVLGNIGGEPATKAVPQLRKALTDSDSGIQAAAAASLANAGEAAAPALDALADTLKRSTIPDVQRNCVIALGVISKSLRGSREPGAANVAKYAVPALVGALETKVEIKDDGGVARAKEQLREDAAEGFANVGYPHNEKALPVLREIIRKDHNPLVRQRCVWALFTCNEIDRFPDLKKVLIDVLDETGDAELMVRYNAARYLSLALKEKAPDRTVDVLLHMLTNTSLRVFEGTGTAVDKVGDESKTGGAKVTARSGGDARFMGAMGLGWLGAKVKKNVRVITALETAAKDPDPKLSKEAAEALEELKK